MSPQKAASPLSTPSRTSSAVERTDSFQEFAKTAQMADVGALLTPNEEFGHRYL